MSAPRLVPRHAVAPPPRSPARDVLAREIEALAAAERDAKVAADIVSRVTASVRAAEQAVKQAEEAVVAARASAAEAIASPTPTGSSSLRDARRQAQDAQDDLDLAREAKKVADARQTSAAAAVDVARLRVRTAASLVIAEPLDRLVSEAEAVRVDYIRRREVIARLSFGADLTRSQDDLEARGEWRHVQDLGNCDSRRDLGKRFCGIANSRLNSSDELADGQAWLNTFDALQRDAEAPLPDR